MEQPAAWSHCLEQAALTDVGLERVNNQDAFAVALADSQADFEQRGHLFTVADGMGAHAAGELASRMVVETVSLVYRKHLDQPPSEAILSAIADANQQIHNRGLASPDFRGMGTTSTTLLLLPVGTLVAHVGDTRAYRWHSDRIEQLTFDHSLVWEMRAAGHFADKQLPGYISRNIITRSIGPHPSVTVDLEGPYPTQDGDAFLLCSDGLSNQVPDDEIGFVLGCLPPAEAVRFLVDLANLRGGPDNITIVVAKVLGPQIAHTSSGGQATPDSSVEFRPVHPGIWIVLWVASLASLGLFALGYPWSALLTLIGAAAAMVTAVVQRYGGTGRRAAMEKRKFGRGPYTASDCAPNPELLGRLNDVWQQLKDSAADENWPVDWSVVTPYLQRASEATQAANYVEAARELLHALMFMMDQLRQQRAAASSDSNVIGQ